MSETTNPEGSAEQSGLISVRLGRLLQRLDERVEAGDFENRSEAVREGTRRMVLEAEIAEREDDPELVTDGGHAAPPTSVAELASRVEDLTVQAIGQGVDEEDAVGALGAVADVLSEDLELDDDPHSYSPDGIYVWDHETEGVVSEDFADLEEARAFADERVGYEAVDGRPLTEKEDVQEADQ